MNFVILGKILKEARNKLGYSQPQVAELFNMTYQNISSWELGKSKIDIESYLRLCNFYGIEAIVPLIEATKDMPDYSSAFPQDEFLSNESELIGKYRDLNTAGKNKIEEYIDDLVESERYVDDKSTVNYWKNKKNSENDLETAEELGSITEKCVKSISKNINQTQLVDKRR